MATIDIAMESTSQQILNKLNSSSSGGGYTSGMQTFTSNGTFTVPAGVYVIYISACGGGGGGAAGWWNGRGGGGGGGAALCYKTPFQVTPGQQIPITIGAGGAGGVGTGWNGNYTNLNGSTGGSTVVGSLITLPGGGGGGWTFTPTSGSTRYEYWTGGYGAQGGGGGGGAGNYDTANVWFPGNGGKASVSFYGVGINTGLAGVATSGSNGIQYQESAGGAGGGVELGGGGGGASLGGWAGNGGNNSTASTTGGFGGGGGGGYYSYGGTPDRQHGAAGAPGVVYIEW